MPCSKREIRPNTKSHLSSIRVGHRSIHVLSPGKGATYYPPCSKKMEFLIYKIKIMKRQSKKGRIFFLFKKLYKKMRGSCTIYHFLWTILFQKGRINIVSCFRNYKKKSHERFMYPIYHFMTNFIFIFKI